MFLKHCFFNCIPFLPSIEGVFLLKLTIDFPEKKQASRIRFYYKVKQASLKSVTELLQK